MSNQRNLQEVITRVFLHVKGMAKQGHRKIAVWTVSTDMLVLAVWVCKELKNVIEELWVDFGAGKGRKYVLILETF